MIMVFFYKRNKFESAGLKLELHCNYHKLPDQINLLLYILLK